MLKGGYQIIDLKNKELTISIGMEYAGIYDKIESTRKVILISGLNVEGTEYHDTFVEFKVNDSSYVTTLYGYNLTVSDTDVITITSL